MPYLLVNTMKGISKVNHFDIYMFTCILIVLITLNFLLFQLFSYSMHYKAAIKQIN